MTLQITRYLSYMYTRYVILLTTRYNIYMVLGASPRRYSWQCLMPSRSKLLPLRRKWAQALNVFME